MKTQSVLALAAVAGMAASASAQTITTAGVSCTISLSWIEDPSGPHNGNGVLDAGEKALILMTLSFTGQSTIGAPDTANPGFFFGPWNANQVTFSPSIGAFSTGYARGLGTAYLNLTSAAGDATGVYNNGLGAGAGPNAGTTGTSGYGVRGNWRLGGNSANGSAVANGVNNIGPGQFPTDPSGVAQLNPISNLDRLGWTPASYAQRTQTFSAAPAAGAGANAVGLYIDFSGMTVNNDPNLGPVGEYQPGSTGGVAYIPLSSVTFGSVNIPIAPAPASLALLGLGGLIAGRRRR